MRSRLIIFIFLLIGIVFTILFARTVYLNRNLPYNQFTEKKLHLLTYGTFMNSSGPGREIVQRFKREHGCDVEVITTTDAGLLMERLKIARVRGAVDVVLGLDGLYLTDARAQIEWHPLKWDRRAWNIPDIVDASDAFVPFDWSALTFIYRQGEVEPPLTFADLTLPRFASAIALQDPRASSPGTQFYYWVRALKGDKTEAFLRELQPNVQSVSPSWAFAYGLFEKKQVRLVFSYLTSLAYHWGVNHDHSFQAVLFPEGHPVQVEYAGIPATCQDCVLAEDFVRTLLEPWAQKLIMQKNFMLPIVKGVEKDSVFEELPQIKLHASTIPANKDFTDWDKVFKR